MTIDWLTPTLTFSGMAIAGGTAWVVRVTRTSSEVRAVDGSVKAVEANHGRRLDGHDEDIRRINQDFVPRHELDAKLQMCLEPINKQLDHQRSLLEYAVMGKRPEMPAFSRDDLAHK